MQINLILACDLDGAIGFADGRLPFKAPADMARFKRLTTGGVVVMGATTFKTLNRPSGLPSRLNVVVSRSGDIGPATGLVRQESDLVACLRRLREEGDALSAWVIGGAQVYQQALASGLVDAVHLTVVHAHSGAEVCAPYSMESPGAFIGEMLRLGQHWVITQTEPADVSDFEDHPPITFITLARVEV